MNIIFMAAYYYAVTDSKCFLSLATTNNCTTSLVKIFAAHMSQYFLWVVSQK